MKKKLPEYWREMTALEIVNKTGIIPCGTCGSLIYELRKESKDKKFKLGDTISAHDFKSMGEWKDPVQGSKMVCPLCKSRMLLTK